MGNRPLYQKALNAFTQEAESLLYAIKTDASIDEIRFMEKIRSMAMSQRAKEQILLNSFMAKGETAAKTFTEFLNAERAIKQMKVSSRAREEDLPSQVLNKLISTVENLDWEEFIEIKGEKISISNKTLSSYLRKEITSVYKEFLPRADSSYIENTAAIAIDNILSQVGLTATGGGTRRVANAIKKAVKENKKTIDSKLITRLDKVMREELIEGLANIDLAEILSANFSISDADATSGILKINIPEGADAYDDDYFQFIRTGVLQQMNQEWQAKFEIVSIGLDFKRLLNKNKPDLPEGSIEEFAAVANVPVSSETLIYLLRNSANEAVGDPLLVEEIIKTLSLSSIYSSMYLDAEDFIAPYDANRIYIFHVGSEFLSFADVLEKLLSAVQEKMYEDELRLEIDSHFGDAWASYMDNRDLPRFENWEGTAISTANQIYISSFLN